MPDPTDPATADETTRPMMHRDYIEEVIASLEKCVVDLRAMLARPVTPASRTDAELIYLAIGEKRRLLLFAFDPKPKPHAWRDAIGCAPRRPGGSNEKPEDVIRRLRGHDDAD